MDLSQLEAFLSICRIRNFTRAAEHLHISQSAVTARIRALEQSLGKTLFLRDNKRVSLTPEGNQFLPYAERMLLLYEESKVTLSEGIEHYIVMSGPGSVWHYRYLQRMVAFRQTHPKTAIKFLSYIDSSYMIRDLLLDGVVQVAIRYDALDRPNLSRKLLFQDEIILVSTQRRAEIMKKADFISGDYYHLQWGGPFSEWFSTIVGAAYVPALETDHSSILLTILLQGTGFGFLPRSIVQEHLDTHRLYVLRCEVPFPVMTAYALYLTENQDQPNVKLALQILDIPNA
ncbi:LysR family transcriptional regulator [Paenibacillus sp. GCM10023252]|uniref:LysR family transcriptional regulator n=1 Tax=Paenibacillus sp. GCM10023252 TaxID=3252649 RepID=UPI00360DD063